METNILNDDEITLLSAVVASKNSSLDLIEEDCIRVLEVYKKAKKFYGNQNKELKVNNSDREKVYKNNLDLIDFNNSLNENV